MSTLGELDRSMEIVANIADHLEDQVAPCPVSRIKLVTWILGRFDDVPALEKAASDLPQLPSALRTDYASWILTVDA